MADFESERLAIAKKARKALAAHNYGRHEASLLRGKGSAIMSTDLFALNQEDSHRRQRKKKKEKKRKRLRCWRRHPPPNDRLKPRLPLAEEITATAQTVSICKAERKQGSKFLWLHWCTFTANCD